MIVVFTGEGKGKTSAALGIALRASGWHKKTAIVQFIKGNKEIGEWKAISENEYIDIFQFLEDKKHYIAEPDRNHHKSIPEIIIKINKIIESASYDIIVLDEVNNAIFYGLVGVGEIIKILRGSPSIDFILTGRNAAPEIIEIADMVTEMNKIKHPFDKKISAKKGIDY